MKGNLALLVLAALLSQMSSFWINPASAQKESNPKQKVEQKSTNLQLIFKPETALAVTVVNFSPDQKLIVTGAEDGTVCIWDNIQGREVQRIKRHSASIVNIVFSPDAEYFLTTSLDKTAKLWKILSDKELSKIELGKAASSQKTIVKELFELKHSGPVTAAAYSPDGNSVLVADANSTVYLWDADDGELFQTFKNNAEISSVGFSPDGKIIVTTDRANIIKFWNAKSGKVISSLQGHSAAIETSAFSPDGKFLATGGNDRTVKIWSVETGTLPKSLLVKDYIRKIMFSPEGGKLSVVDAGASVRVFDVRSGQEIRMLTSQGKFVGAVEFSPDGRYLIAAREDNSVGLISLETGKEFCRLISFKDETWTVIDSSQRFDASENVGKNLEYNYEKEIIALEQLKDAYYEPRLLAKLLGFVREPLRAVTPLEEIKIYPEISARKIEGTKLTFTLKNRGGGIGEVQVFVNDKLAYADVRDEFLKSNQFAAERTLAVDLTNSSYRKGRANRVKIVTSNYLKETGKGNLQSPGTEVIWNAPGEVELSTAKFYAIVAGVSDYAGDALDLRFAAKDAEEMANALRLGAKQLFSEKNTHITVLSTSGSAGTIMPTKENIRKAFDEVANNSAPDDVVLVYFAGRSATLARDTFFYLTQEANSTRSEDLAKNYPATAISTEELSEFFGRSRTRKQVLILDTTSPGVFTNSFTQVADLPSDQIRAIARLKDRTGVFVLMGAASNAVSYEASQYGQGLLTYSLLQGMKGASLGENQFVDIRLLFDYAQETVPQMAKNIGGIQRPYIFTPDTKASFDIGLFTAAEQRQIKLSAAKPVILRPNMRNSALRFDDLKLTQMMNAQLRELSVANTSGSQSRIVFVETDEMKDGITPFGDYEIEGKTVKVKLVLVRNNVTLSAITLVGSLDNLKELVESITQKIIESLNELASNLKKKLKNKQVRAEKTEKTKPKVSVVQAKELLAAREKISYSEVKFSTRNQTVNVPDEKAPLVTRPVVNRKMPDGKEIPDDIGLGEEVRKQIQKYSDEAASGAKDALAPIFMPANEYKGAYRPEIVYSVDGKKVKARLTVYRDLRKVTDSIPITGTTDDLALLAESIFDMIRDRVVYAVQTKGVEIIDADAAEEILNSKGRDYALFIANDDYKYLRPLQNPVDDVLTIAERLKDIYGFEVEFAGPTIDGKKVIKTETMNDFWNEINMLKRRSFDVEKDQLMIFISGHGDWDGDIETGEGVGYYAVKQSQKRLDDPNHGTYIPFDVLKKVVSSIKCKHILLVIDSCFSGAIDESTTKADDIYGEMSNAEYISKKMTLTTRKVLTSGELEYTWDGAKGKHSPFVAKFIESLDTRGGDDGILTTLEIYTRLEKLNPQPKRGKFADKDDNSSEFLFVRKQTPVQ